MNAGDSVARREGLGRKQTEWKKREVTEGVKRVCILGLCNLGDKGGKKGGWRKGVERKNWAENLEKTCGEGFLKGQRKQT